MLRSLLIAGSAAALGAAMPALAQPGPDAPPPGAPTRDAQPFLFKAGQSDVFEISTSQMAVMRARRPEVRAYATMLIQHHTMTTNQALAAAKAAGVTPPPPVLDARQRAMITELMNAPADGFDRVYLAQQVPAHEEALALQQAYAAQGDTAQLRVVARGAVPIVTQHLTRAQQLLGRRR